MVTRALGSRFQRSAQDPFAGRGLFGGPQPLLGNKAVLCGYLTSEELGGSARRKFEVWRERVECSGKIAKVSCVSASL